VGCGVCWGLRGKLGGWDGMGILCCSWLDCGLWIGG